ncbi:MAG: hypothetical protein FJ244_00630 [Nitrospira sp.]|nr:hypothetical protein [Nitrospira sp.]
MPKLITAHYPGQVDKQAREYVRTFILFPSGIVGLFCLVSGIGGLGYQWMATDTYSWTTFAASSMLILVGVVLGIAQTSYHRFIFAKFPEVWAARMSARMKQRAGGNRVRMKKETPAQSIEHPGRQLIPVAYLAGVALLVGSGVAGIVYGEVHPIPAVLMPWAGFYWAKLFLWRRVIMPEKP